MLLDVLHAEKESESEIGDKNASEKKESGKEKKELEKYCDKKTSSNKRNGI